MVLTESLINNFALSVSFVASITIISLLGVLIFGRYDGRCSKKENSYFLVILNILLIHFILDTIIESYSIASIIRLGFIWDFILLFSFLIVFYLLWKKLDKFWAFFVLLFLIICVCADILITFYQHIYLFEIIHFLSILGLFIGMCFLVIKFLIDNLEGERIKC